MFGRSPTSWICLLATALFGCSEPPAPLAEKLAAQDAELARRLAPAPGAWLEDGNAWTSPGWRSAKMGPFYEVGARLPRRADGAISVGIGQSEAYTITLTPEDARAAPLEEDAGRATYRAAYPSTGVVFVADPQRVEWFLLLASDAAPARFAWRVALPTGLPRVEREASGALVLRSTRTAPAAKPRSPTSTAASRSSSTAPA